MKDDLGYIVTPTTSVKVACPLCRRTLVVPIDVTDGGYTEDGDRIITLTPREGAIDWHVEEHSKESDTQPGSLTAR